jgi:hypothetical protein
LHRSDRGLRDGGTGIVAELVNDREGERISGKENARF